MILANSLTALTYLAVPEIVTVRTPTATPLFVFMLGMMGVANVLFAVALFKWKKWGFYGFAAMGLVGLVLNLSIGIGILPALFGLSGFALLYWTMQMGGERRAWPHLE